MEVVFWISVVLTAYIYAGYPVLAGLLARLCGREVHHADILPRVTVLIAAYNEVKHIADTIQNKLDQDYPAHLLNVLVISDGSTDGTDDVVRQFRERVTLLRQEPRAGKTAALNCAVEHVQEGIIVFSDANSMYGRDAVRQLVTAFADPEVGYVTGKMVYVNPDGSLIGDGCSAYMRYENLLRAAESRLASVIGVDGGIDAVRRELYTPMRNDQLPDFVLPLQVARAGYRAVYQPEALLREDALSSHDSEYRMRVRVSLRALWALWDLKELLNPMRRPLLSLQIVSHKVLRYLAFVPLAAAWASSLALAPAGGIYALAAAAQTAFYLLAGLGWAVKGRAGGSLVGLPYYFLLLNLASAHALVRFCRGQKQALWTPRTG